MFLQEHSRTIRTSQSQIEGSVPAGTLAGELDETATWIWIWAWPTPAWPSRIMVKNVLVGTLCRRVWGSAGRSDLSHSSPWGYDDVGPRGLFLLS